MDDLLKELELFLRKHNATIVRSANSSNDLVLCKDISPTESKEVIFHEEIGETSIRNEWYFY